MTRTAPHDVAAEQAVIGAVLLAPHLLADLADQLAPDDFHRPAHGLLWGALVDRHRAGEPVDPIALTAHLAEVGLLTRMGGAPYVHALIASVPATASAEHYAGIVVDHARRRQVVSLGERLADLAGSGRDTPKWSRSAESYSPTPASRPGRHRSR